MMLSFASLQIRNFSNKSCHSQSRVQHSVETSSHSSSGLASKESSHGVQHFPDVSAPKPCLNQFPANASSKADNSRDYQSTNQNFKTNISNETQFSTLQSTKTQNQSQGAKADAARQQSFFINQSTKPDQTSMSQFSQINNKSNNNPTSTTTTCYNHLFDSKNEKSTE